MLEIKFNDISFGYEDKKNIYDNFNLKLSEGIHGLLGPNGAGKTTLIKMLVGLLKPDSGSITFNGEDIKSIKDYKSIISYMPQDKPLYNEFKAIEFLKYISTLKGLKYSANDCLDMLEKVELASNYKDRVGNFSGGMKQRLLLAATLMGEPKIVVLDEPTTGLDPKQRIRFRNILSTFSKDRIILYSSHIIGEITMISNNIVVLKNGKLLNIGSPKDLIKNFDSNVYEFEVNSKEELKELTLSNFVSSVQLLPNGYKVRIVSDKVLPYEKSIPTLEEVYITNVGEGKDNNGYLL